MHEAEQQKGRHNVPFGDVGYQRVETVLSPLVTPPDQTGRREVIVNVHDVTKGNDLEKKATPQQEVPMLVGGPIVVTAGIARTDAAPVKKKGEPKKRWQPTSEELVGDDKDTIMAKVVHVYGKALHSHAIRAVGNAEVASDLVQDTLLRAFVSGERFTTGTNFNAWIHKILANKIKDYYRRRTDNREFVIDDATFFENIAHGETLRPSEEDHTVYALKVRNFLVDQEYMSENWANILVMAEVLGMDYKDIAHVLGIQMGTVKSSLSRAKKRFANIAASEQGAVLFDPETVSWYVNGRRARNSARGAEEKKSRKTRTKI